MINIEQVEKLRQYGNISFEDAKRALEETDGNMLDAVILLEKEGKIETQGKTGGFTPDCQSGNESGKSENRGGKSQETKTLGEITVSFLKWCGKVIHKGNLNKFEVTRNGEDIISIPITLLVVLLICFFWVIIPLVVIGLFFNFRYAFSGPDLGKECINSAANTAADAVDGIKKSVKDAVNENKNRKDTDN